MARFYSNLILLARWTAKELFPFRSLSYYADYIHLIREGRHAKWPLRLKTIRWIVYFQLIKPAIFLSLFVANKLKHLDDNESKQNEITSNEHHQNVPITRSMELHNIGILLSPLSAYYYRMMYFCNDTPVTDLIYNIIIMKKSGKFYIERKYRNRTVIRLIQWSALVIINSVQIAVGAIELLALVTQWKIFKFVASDYHYYLNTMDGLSRFLSMEWLLWNELVRILLFTHPCILTLSMGFIVIVLFYIKFCQIKLYLVAMCARLDRNRLMFDCSARLNHILTHYTKTLVLFLIANRLYGRVLTAFLLVNCPLNAYFVISFILGTIPLAKHQIQWYLWAGGQLVGTLGIHLMAAKFVTFIHRPSQQLFHISTRVAPPLPFRTKLSLDTYIQITNSRNRYGVTYGSIGLITVGAFLKSLLFYYKFMVINYKLIKHRQNE